ncbi:MAG: pyridoxamine 5'-phosphate oxidase family protein [Clostridiales Family XIII bacterium]|jgi:predicted pyridoxine 5'-phosphate oxidase superfamily flavin-nucleotide-binding protein|nr:pyridoxamine 5'-phosphate oxidase family protein [Clostridiales Family XIII bacterium]
MSKYDFNIFENEKTLDYIATVNEDGTPHITVFSSVLIHDEETLMFGEYCRGKSKDNILNNPFIGILAMTPEGTYATGTACWTKRLTSGPEHELFNNIPRLRYNATYGYEFIHFLSVQDFSTLQRTDAAAISESTLKTEAAAAEATHNQTESVVPYVGRQLFAEDDALKFIAYVDSDGYPQLVYVPQAKLVEGNIVVLDTSLNSEELNQIPDDAPVAIMAMVPRLGASIQVEGNIQRETRAGADILLLNILRVYSGNTPKAGYIYPPEPIDAVRLFRGALDV